MGTGQDNWGMHIRYAALSQQRHWHQGQSCLREQSVQCAQDELASTLISAKAVNVCAVTVHKGTLSGAMP